MNAATTALATSVSEGAQSSSLAPRFSERWPFYADDEITAVADVLRSGRVNQWTGNEVFDFERAFSSHLGVKNGIAVANGSVAIELALRALGIGPGDEVVVTPRSFVASASCVRLVGALPVFADVDADTGNLTAETIAAVLTPRTRAVMPVHLAGWPADMPAILALAARHGLKVIEDCAQAHGAEVDGRPVGSFGDASAYSFCQDKIISTGGEGGFTSFKSAEAWEWAWSFKDHGKNWSKVNSPQAQVGFRWLHDEVGTNWRLTGPQAAIGIIQLGKLIEWRALRARNAAIWTDALRNARGLRVPLPDSRFRHAHYKLYAYVDVPSGASIFRDEILRRAEEAGLRVFSGSCSEIYREGAFRDLAQPDLPVAKMLGESSIMVEVHPTLDPNLLSRRAEVLAGIADVVLR